MQYFVITVNTILLEMVLVKFNMIKSWNVTNHGVTSINGLGNLAVYFYALRFHHVTFDKVIQGYFSSKNIKKIILSNIFVK